MRYDGKYLIILFISLCVMMLLFMWYKNSFDPYSNPSTPIKQIKKMYMDVYPEKGNVPVKEGNEAYTLNKKSITICLKDPETKKYYSWNTISYVALHELAHVITTKTERDSKGKKDDHGPVFKRNFKMLLKRAELLGYFDPKTPIPDTYCGV